MHAVITGMGPMNALQRAKELFQDVVGALEAGKRRPRRGLHQNWLGKQLAVVLVDLLGLFVA